MMGWLQRLFLKNSDRQKKEELRRQPRAVVAVRMEAIGGQGANSAGKILAEAGVMGMGYTGNHFSSFGSEKRGSPVRSFVRLSPEHLPVRSAAFIQNPDYLVIFHESLMEKHPEILDGVSEKTEIVINSSKKLKRINFPKGIHFDRVHLVAASEIALKKKCGLNAVMLGALSQVCPQVPPAVLQSYLQKFFSKLGEKALEANLEGFHAGQKKVKSHEFKSEFARTVTERSTLPVMGYLNSPQGGVVVNPGNTVLRDHSASRKGTAPRLFTEVCFNCGYCDMVCPDYCFVWQKSANEPPKLLGIDYQFCKGCQKCVEACPVQALAVVNEEEIPSEEKVHKVHPQAFHFLQTEKISNRDWSLTTAEEKEGS